GRRTDARSPGRSRVGPARPPRLRGRGAGAGAPGCGAAGATCGERSPADRGRARGRRRWSAGGAAGRATNGRSGWDPPARAEPGPGNLLEACLLAVLVQHGGDEDSLAGGAGRAKGGQLRVDLQAPAGTQAVQGDDQLAEAPFAAQRADRAAPTGQPDQLEAVVA